MGRVLVVDDEPAIVRSFSTSLRAQGFEVDQAGTGEQALRIAASGHPEAVILDLGLPGMGGLEVIRQLRGWTAVPILVVSGWSSEADKVAALDAGADDYVAKPVGIPELLARLRAALRRADPGAEPVVGTGSFRVDLPGKQVERLDGTPVPLTPIEWRVLEVLARKVGRLVTTEEVLAHVWGPAHRVDTNALRVHLTHLREKLEPERHEPRHLMTEVGSGYRLVP